MPDFNSKCALCKKPRGNHKAGSLHCPRGRKSRAVGYTDYAKTTFQISTKGIDPKTAPKVKASISVELTAKQLNLITEAVDMLETDWLGSTQGRHPESRALKSLTAKILNAAMKLKADNDKIIDRSTVPPEVSGVKGTVLWIDASKMPAQPHLRVQRLYSGSNKIFPVTISKPAVFIRGMPPVFEREIAKFIEINYELLMKFWKDEIDTKDFLAEIKPINAEK